VHAEALAVMVAVTSDFVFNRWDLEIFPYYRIRHIWVPCASVIMRRAFDWKRSSISILDVDAVPQSYSVGPDWFEYSFVDEFVVYRDFWFASE
jgi:hypothetical protein